MTYTKCPRCGLVNWSEAEVCERCAAPHADDGPAALTNDEVEARSDGNPEARAPQAAPREFPVHAFGGDVSTDSKTWKLLLAIVCVVLLGGGALAVYKWRASSRRSGALEAMRKAAAPPTLDERTRDTLLSYLAQPGFGGTEVVYQVLGPARLELVQVDDREVYFSAPTPEQSGEEIEATIARFVADRKRVVLASDDGAGRLRLGDYSLPRSADKNFLFKTPVDNLRFNPETVLRFPYGRTTYTLDMRELGDFLASKSVFGGRMIARSEEKRAGRTVVFANHGAFVARPEEPSLRRFVGELVRDLPAAGDGAREARVQRVLDFVSREIAYNLREATYDFEMLKKPNEVLMTGESDCSNKTILLGSLLEQLGEDYLFVYTPDHITVAVPQGRFPASNGLSLLWEGQTWLIAEGTVPGFRIGLDRVQEQDRLTQFRHVQRPRQRDAIYDIATGRQLSFQ